VPAPLNIYIFITTKTSVIFSALEFLATLDQLQTLYIYIVTYQGGLRELRDVDSDWYSDLFAQMRATQITITGNTLALAAS
jgi:hypothetical protein